jgi:hypothetical protein
MKICPCFVIIIALTFVLGKLVGRVPLWLLLGFIIVGRLLRKVVMIDLTLARLLAEI